LAFSPEQQSYTGKGERQGDRGGEGPLARGIRAIGKRLKQIKLGYLYFKSTDGLQDFASVKKMVFLCYGNICRSAFAEHYARKVFSKIGLDLEIVSRGTCATPGKKSPDIAVEAARAFGVDLSNHEALVLSEEDLGEQVMVIGMDLRNFDFFRRRFPIYRKKFFLLKHLIQRRVIGGNLNDPFGLPAEEYRRVFKEIVDHIDQLGIWRHETKG
jgi:protein-tyrosine phosphatase